VPDLERGGLGILGSDLNVDEIPWATFSFKDLKLMSEVDDEAAPRAAEDAAAVEATTEVPAITP